MEPRQRKRIRLENRDYSRAGYYFVTICVKDRWPILYQNKWLTFLDNAFLSEAGILVKQGIEQISVFYESVRVDKYVVMPNHIHMILVLGENDGRTMCAPTQNPSVSTIVRMLKEFVTKSLGYSIWQKSFHDHIIRSEPDYLRIWEYIETNPAKWEEDCYYEPPKEQINVTAKSCTPTCNKNPKNRTVFSETEKSQDKDKE